MIDKKIQLEQLKIQAEDRKAGIKMALRDVVERGGQQ
jgi:hypothetical protein